MYMLFKFRSATNIGRTAEMLELMKEMTTCDCIDSGSWTLTVIVQGLNKRGPWFEIKVRNFGVDRDGGGRAQE